MKKLARQASGGQGHSEAMSLSTAARQSPVCATPVPVGLSPNEVWGQGSCAHGQRLISREYRLSGGAS